MHETVELTGLYVRLAGAEYRVISKGGWALWSAKPTPGFKKHGGNGFIRPIQPGEQMDSYRIAHRGTYRGLPVDLYPSTEGRAMVISRDSRAREVGFDPLDRAEWVKLIPLDDSDLSFTTTRSPEPGPWMKGTAGSGHD